VVWIRSWPVYPRGASLLEGTHFVAGSGWRDAQTVGGGQQVATTRLVGDLAGNAAIVWVPGSFVPAPPAFSRLSVAGGWRDSEAIDSLTAGMWPEQLAMGASGTAVLALRPPAGAPSALRFDPATFTWSEPVALALGAGQSASLMDVDTGSSGSALVVWTQAGSATRATVWAAELSASLQWGAPTALHGAASGSPQCSDLNAGGEYDPAVRLDASGRALAVWGEFDCVRRSIWANRFMLR
jgi:hypothetical protein